MSDETRRTPEPEEDPQKIATGMTLAESSTVPRCSNARYRTAGFCAVSACSTHASKD